jgi:hypothetical protein
LGLELNPNPNKELTLTDLTPKKIDHSCDPKTTLMRQVRARVGAQKKGKLSGLGFWPDSEASCDVHASVMDERASRALTGLILQIRQRTTMVIAMG